MNYEEFRNTPFNEMSDAMYNISVLTMKIAEYELAIAKAKRQIAIEQMRCNICIKAIYNQGVNKPEEKSATSNQPVVPCYSAEAMQPPYQFSNDPRVAGVPAPQSVPQYVPQGIYQPSTTPVQPVMPQVQPVSAPVQTPPVMNNGSTQTRAYSAPKVSNGSFGASAQPMPTTDVTMSTSNGETYCGTDESGTKKRVLVLVKECFRQDKGEVCKDILRRYNVTDIRSISDITAAMVSDELNDLLNGNG